MTHAGMKFSRVRRAGIADSIEAVVQGHAYDGLVAFGGCDKTLPGAMMGTPGVMPGAASRGQGSMVGMEQEHARLCATTEDFDLVFIDAMIPHHQMAVIMATMATMRAEHPDLQTLAHTMVDDQQPSSALTLRS